MNSKTKIIVLHMKEIIYTVIFATLGILILCLLFFMFSGDRHSSVSDKKYTPGVYTSSFTLGNEDLELEVSVSDTSINSIRTVSYTHLDVYKRQRSRRLTTFAT